MAQMERPTVKFTTKGGNEVILNKYITGREEEALNAALIGDVEMEIVDKVQRIKGDITGDAKAKKKSLEFLIVELNGSRENVVERVMDLPSDEYNEIINKINEITDKDKKKAETDSSKSSENT